MSGPCDDEFDLSDPLDDLCPTCGGDGWGIVGTDWDCDDAINGPYNGQIERCPNCRGSGKLKDCEFI
jgi:hypothetical protein